MKRMRWRCWLPALAAALCATAAQGACLSGRPALADEFAQATTVVVAHVQSARDVQDDPERRLAQDAWLASGTVPGPDAYAALAAVGPDGPVLNEAIARVVLDRSKHEFVNGLVVQRWESHIAIHSVDFP